MIRYLLLAVSVAMAAVVAEPARSRAESIGPPTFVTVPHRAQTFTITPSPPMAQSVLPPKPPAGAMMHVMATPATLTCTPPQAPNEIVELARALDWNPDLIFEYVYNNIQTLPIYASLKGPFGALIDGVGTPIDQAELMYVLLQQSCYSPQYEIGTIYVPIAQLTAWLGTDNNLTDIGLALIGNGFPDSGTCSYGAGSPVLCFYGSGTTVTGVDLPWVWVSAPIPNGGVAYQFEPSSKTFKNQTGYGSRFPTDQPRLGSIGL
jgi:hypothetical protein